MKKSFSPIVLAKRIYNETNLYFYDHADGQRHDDECSKAES
jgi:hypothetical protein